MAGIRTLERDGYGTTKPRTYATVQNAVNAATEIATSLKGMVNVTICPVLPDDLGTLTTGGIRYTPVFSCFSEESDIFDVARMGKGFIVYR